MIKRFDMHVPFNDTVFFQKPHSDECSSGGNTVEIIEKWYKKLNFPKSYDSEFYTALKNIPVSDAINIENYDTDCQDGKRNLLSFLFMCEKNAKYYEENNIGEDILTATLSDLPLWTTIWSNIKGELYLGELNWLKYHLSGRIFRLGRLQFAFGKIGFDIPEHGVKLGDNVIEIHIPRGGKLSPEECSKSLDIAKEFFAKHFPDYDYRCFTCHSWLLDETLKKYLPENSNILLFADMFTKVSTEKSSAILKYIFRWDATPENLPYMAADSVLAQKIKSACLNGETFYATTGIIKK